MNHVDFATAAKMYFANYANFKGRSTRAEYWWAMLMVFIISTVANFIPFVSIILSLALLIPNLAILTRRFHDTGRSGKWVILFWIISIIGIIITIYPFVAEIAAYGEAASDPHVLAQIIAANISKHIGTYIIGMLIAIVPGIVCLIWTLLPSGPDNKYGPNPYGQANKL